MAAFFRFVLICYSTALTAAICLAIFEPPDFTESESESGVVKTIGWTVLLLLLAHALLSDPWVDAESRVVEICG